MKIMCPPGYHHNIPVATHPLRQMMYGYDHLRPFISLRVVFWFPDSIKI